MTKPKSTAEKRYLVTKTSGLTTGAGFYASGEYVPESALDGSLRRLLRTGAIVDLGLAEPAPAKPTKAKAEPEPAPDPVTEKVVDSDLPTLAADSPASGVVAQAIPVVLRFIAAHPERAGSIVAAERKRDKPRQSIIKAGLAAGGAARKS